MARSYLPLVAAAVIAIVGGMILLRLQHHGVSPAQARRGLTAGCSQVAADYGQHASGVWVTMSGRVTRLLPDEYGRYRHQRFILACPASQTVLIVNDVSIGQRVPVHVGDEVAVRGQYVWNRLGGLIHFTHHDPQGGQGGWILLNSRVYALGRLAPI